MFSSVQSKTTKSATDKINDAAAVFVISEKSVINGNVSTNEPAVVGGTIEGSINVENSFVLEKTGIIRGPVFCKTADVSGSINGNLICKGAVVLHSKANITGDLQCTSLVLEQGVYFCGKVICAEPEPVQPAEVAETVEN